VSPPNFQWHLRSLTWTWWADSITWLSHGCPMIPRPSKAIQGHGVTASCHSPAGYQWDATWDLSQVLSQLAKIPLLFMCQGGGSYCS
jgi:hypothetical protein